MQCIYVVNTFTQRKNEDFICFQYKKIVIPSYIIIVMEILEDRKSEQMTMRINCQCGGHYQNTASDKQRCKANMCGKLEKICKLCIR